MNTSRFIFLITVLGLFMSLASPAAAHAVLDTDLIYRDFSQRFVETNPPVAPVRPVAEFEPSSAVLIRYPLGIPLSLVTQLSNTAQVICIVSSTNVQNTATNAFNNAGVNMANVVFMIAPTDSYWTRDYGPWFIFDGNDVYSVVDFQYNRPRPYDNNIPQLWANANGVNYYGMNLQQTGGNYMTDGINTALQSHIAYSENSSLGQTGVNNRMLQYLGITNYFVIQDPNGTYIDHIDCWGKFLAPDKILIRSVNSNHASYNALETIANNFANTNCAWGYPYKVYRVYTPNNQPYTNSLILNKKVFVPIMNSTYDTAALNVYRNAMPGYEVIGVLGAGSTPWQSTDALHCRTHEVPDPYMIWIGHQPNFGTTASEFIDINAEIKSYSNGALIADSVYVAYKVNQGSWQSSLLTHLSAGHYTTSLSGFAPGDSVFYYINAVDTAGKRNTHPLTGAYDSHVFVMQQDNVPPQITHTALEDIIYTGDPIIFEATVTDNYAVSQVFFRYRWYGGAVQEYPMLESGNNRWIFPYVPEILTATDSFEYQFRALDNSSPANVAYYPSQTQWIQLNINIVSNDESLVTSLSPRLISHYPNPFRSGRDSALSIELLAAKSSRIELEIYNLRGQLVYRSESRAASEGLNQLEWNGRDRSGNLATTGVYILNLIIDDSSHRSKIVVGL